MAIFAFSPVVVQVRDIPHITVSIPFNSLFKFSDKCTRSHSLSIATISSTINAYRYSFFFVNSPFVWNSVTAEVLQIKNSGLFRAALKRFLLD